MNDRIIDANLNRLAEGMRVVEDVCRFGLEDSRLAGRLKALRREAGRLRGEWPRGLTASRDAVGDVGRVEIKEPDRRDSVASVLGASFGRVGESLRVIEEIAKLDRPAAARRAKAMRYEVYELEREIAPLFDRKERVEGLRGLYIIMTAPAAGYEKLAEIAVKEKVAAVQLRDKHLGDCALLALARRLRAITAGGSTLFVVNDRPDIAALSDADGLHLGQDDLPVTEARRLVGDRMLIGKSTHNLRQLRAALKESPDYVAIGPVFATRSKSDPSPTLGLEKARRMLEACPAPAVAIGGINRSNLSSLPAIGFGSHAILSPVCSVAKPRAAIRAICGRPGNPRLGADAGPAEKD